jgi:hypothetical protein
MLKAILKAWSWNFSLQERDGTPVADVLHSSSGKRYDITLRDGSRYTIRRRGIGSPFLLEAADGSEIAQAEAIAFFREFVIAYGAQQYTLKAISWMRRECGVLVDGVQLGRVLPESWWTPCARVEIAGEFPLVLQTFLVWLTLLLWEPERNWDAHKLELPPCG